MDAKITLSFDATVIKEAKQYAAENHISLSRLTEFLLRKVTSSCGDKPYPSLEDYPISDWVNMVAEGQVEYKRTPSKNQDLKEEYFKSKK